MSRRLVLALDLVSDAALIAAYEALHQPGAVWPDVLSCIKAVGFLDMQIYRLDDRMVMVAEVADDYPRLAPPSLSDAMARWEELMWRFQKPVPGAGAGEKWLAMRQIFDLSSHPDPKGGA